MGHSAPGRRATGAGRGWVVQHGGRRVGGGDHSGGGGGGRGRVQLQGGDSNMKCPDVCVWGLKMYLL